MGQADAIALVLGELAVNSAKHGALTAGGSIHVGADTTDKSCAITWTESSASQVSAHRRPGGQGLALIDRIVTARGGTLAIDWRENGLTVVLRFALG